MRPATTSSGRRLALAVATAVATVLTACACTAASDPIGPPSPDTTAGASAPAKSGTSGAPGAPATSGSSSSDPTADVRAAVTTVLAQRAASVAAKDKDAWLASLADSGSPFGAAQASLFDRLVAMPVSGLIPRQVSLDPSTAAADAYVANVQLAYRFAGYDQGDRAFAVSYVVTRAPAGWRLSGPGPGRTDPQPFDIDGATSVSSPATLVIGDVAPQTLRAYQDLGDAAQEPITAAWGQARPSVIVAPKTTAELEAQLGRGSFAGLDQVAAITDGPLKTGEPAQSDRVYLNPDAVGRLSADGRRVVVTHELTHVTIRGSTTRPVPIWLSEGYADEVAFRGTGLPPRTVAADLLALVQDGKGPTALPTSSDFDPSKGTIAPTYNAAWLAVLLIRDQYGQDKLTELYRAVSGGPTADAPVAGSAEVLTRQAFPAVLGVSQDAFVADWMAYLDRLAG